MRAWAVALFLPLGLMACKRQDMYTQDRSQTWDSNSVLPNGTTMQSPVSGTVAHSADLRPMFPPTTIDKAMLARGKERFDIFCTPCHGETGNGEGMIVQRGFPKPPSLVEGKLRTAKAEVFFDAITNGYGTMYSFADRVGPPDRWAIVAYIRALQLSQNADVANLPTDDRAKLEALK